MNEALQFVATLTAVCLLSWVAVGLFIKPMFAGRGEMAERIMQKQNAILEHIGADWRVNGEDEILPSVERVLDEILVRELGQRHSADAHIKLMKSALLNTFPGADKPMPASVLADPPRQI